MILSTLRVDGSGGEHKIDLEDLHAILRNLAPFFNEEYWEKEGDSIWNFEEAFNFILLQQTANLIWLHHYMIKHPDVTCVFYDSY